MPSTLKLLLGEAGSGKTGTLVAEYRARLQAQRELRQPGRTLWLAPARRAVQEVVERLLDPSQPVQFAPQVMTFDVFAEQVLLGAGRPVSPISSVMKRLLFRRIVADLRSRQMLTSFASVSHTSGFLDVVSSFVSELKREEIWPDVFLSVCAHRPPRLAARDGELGKIYHEYQQHLTVQNWYDNEGRFWLAKNALERGERGRFANVEFLVVDGFADFTQTQYKILQLLLGWIPQAVISLPHEKPLGGPSLFESPLARPELFAKPHHTVECLKRYIPPGVVCRTQRLDADRSQTPSGLRTVADYLFCNPRLLKPKNEAEGIEIIAATGPEGERRAVARRIKELLQGGVAPRDIVVAMRSVAETGSVWHEFFVDAGIPTWCEAGTPLNSSPLIKALFGVLQMEREDWPFERLLHVMDSNYFRPEWSEYQAGRGVRAVATSLRLLKLHKGRELMLRVVGRAASDGDLDLDLGDDAESEAASSATARALPALAHSAVLLLSRLSKITDRLRHRHTLSDWSDVISSLAEELGWRKNRKDSSATAVADNRDWDLLQGIIRTAAEADYRFATANSTDEDPKPKLSLEEFIEELRDLLRSERIKASPETGGCVRLLDVEQARHLDVQHLFVVGLSESSFPRNRSDDCLFGESERQEFARRGINLKHQELYQRDEMFLFYSIVTRARTRLTLSYPAVNSAGQPVFPSPYLAALRGLFAAGRVEVSQEGQLDPVPVHNGILTPTDLRLAAINDVRQGNGGLFVRLCSDPEWRRMGLNVRSAIHMNTYRFHERGFTQYEGRLGSSGNLHVIQQRFGSRHQFSATELEAYAVCPFRFWLATVLNINPVESPEEGTDHAARGSLIHDVLAQLLREGLKTSPESLAARFCELIDQRLARRIHETDLQRAMTRIERRLLADWGKAFAVQQVEYETKLKEAWSGSIGSLPPEISFGRLPGTSSESDETTYPPLQFGDAEQKVNVRGRIDRVDMGSFQGQRVFNVIDYKSGMPPKSTERELMAGRSLQLALYALAVQRLGLAGTDAGPFSMGYWSLKSTGYTKGFQKRPSSLDPINAAEFDSLQQIVEDVIPRLASGIRSGKFLVENEDEDCTGRCPYHTACRVNQIRNVAFSLNKFGDILGPNMSPEEGNSAEPSGQEE